MLEKDLTKLDRLSIRAFTKVERDGDPISMEEAGTFEAPVSIDAFSQRYAIQYQKTGGINSSADEATPAKSKAKQLQFNIILDNTCLFNSDLGTLGKEQKSIMEQVNRFLTTCYKYDEEAHSPRFLKIEWGELKFDCKLLSAEVNYSLFDKGGNPLRAEIDAVFIEDEWKKIALKSPDITHSQMIRAGDTLPLIARKVYGASSYYLKLAKYNKINHFRELAAGQEVLLPPLKELEEV